MSKFFKGQVVKYSNPQPGEETERFYVNEIHEADGELKEKLHIELICDKTLKPTFCFFSEEFEASYIEEQVMYNGVLTGAITYGRL